MADEDKVREVVDAMTFPNGKGRDLSIDELAIIQPGLGRIMPEIGARTWKLYYAGKAENWPYAMYQYKETKKLFELGAITRPKHEDAIEEYLRDSWKPLEAAIQEENLEKFLAAFDQAVDDANAWHEKKEKAFIVWQVPDHPPPDIDFHKNKRK